MTGVDCSERGIAPNDDRLKHGIHFPLEVRGPVARRIDGGVKVGVEVEDGVERRVLAGLEPGLANEHGSKPSLLQGEPGEDVGQAFMGQIGPFGSRGF